MLNSEALHHGQNSFEKCNSAIAISGCARSGTSIVSRLVHSFQSVELSYEPPVLLGLLPSINQLAESEWCLLYEIFLYEEILMNSICGRSLNCNRGDDSSIFLVKSEDIIESRLSRSIKKIDAHEISKSSHIAYKTVSMIPYFSKVQKYYPKTRFVVVQRKASELFQSLLKKSWFSNKTLSESADLMYPVRLVDGIRVPFWVAEGDTEHWAASDELHRIAYYYLRMNRSLSSIDNPIIIRYDELISNPYLTVWNLAGKLNVQFGNKTEEIIKTISRQSEPADNKVFDTLDSEIFSDVMYWSNLWSELSK